MLVISFNIDDFLYIIKVVSSRNLKLTVFLILVGLYFVVHHCIFQMSVHWVCLNASYSIMLKLNFEKVQFLLVNVVGI